MSILSSLIFFLLFTPLVYGYTVVLESGKKVTGTLISENDRTIVIKDAQGVLISFQKKQLDLNAMEAANAVLASTQNNSVSGSRRNPTIAEIAEETKRKRTGRSKIVTLADIDRATGLSILGPQAAEQKPLKSDVDDKDAVGREWQKRLWPLKKEVNRLREKMISAESSCEEARNQQQTRRTTPSRKPVELMSTYKETPACKRMEEIASQLREAEQRWETAREEARRAGVSWQILD